MGIHISHFVQLIHFVTEGTLASPRLHLYAGSSYHVLRETMTRFEQMLDPARFVRIHRSVMVNVDRIREIEPHFHGDHIVWLADGQRLTLSRNYRSALKGRFGPEF